MDAVRKLILDRLDDLGLTMSEASVKIGRNHAYLQQFLKRGIPEQLKESDRERLSELLGVPQEQLRGKSAPLPAKEYVKAYGTEANTTRLISKSEGGQNFVDSRSPIPSNSASRDLPVFGTAQGGRGALIVSDRPVDWELRPDFLLRVEDAYGMIVTGDSMAPEHKNGSTALVNPHLPPRNGDTCIFRSHKDDGEVVAMIKELRRFNDTTWFVHQHNPKRDFTLKRTEWQVCHVTVGNYFRR